jgi:hypothetical protein
MKKISLLAITALMFVNLLHAQKAKFGVHIGNTLSSYKLSIESVSVTSKQRVGYTAGVFGYIPVGGSFSLMPALNYVQKGGRIKHELGKDIQILNYVELPVNVLYRVRAGSGTLVLGGGPSLSAGVSGKAKWEQEGETGSDKIEFGSGSDKDLKAIEAGLNFMAGYIAADGFMVSLNFNQGLSNLAPDNEFDVRYRNRYFGLRVGYLISK